MENPKVAPRTMSPELRIFVQMLVGKDREISLTGVVQVSRRRVGSTACPKECAETVCRKSDLNSLPSRNTPTPPAS
jgi:hypothetical protein